MKSNRPEVESSDGRGKVSAPKFLAMSMAGAGVISNRNDTAIVRASYGALLSGWKTRQDPFLSLLLCPAVDLRPI